VDTFSALGQPQSPRLGNGLSRAFLPECFGGGTNGARPSSWSGGLEPAENAVELAEDDGENRGGHRMLVMNRDKSHDTPTSYMISVGSLAIQHEPVLRLAGGDIVAAAEPNLLGDLPNTVRMMSSRFQ
jgi:hypothetical protein